MIVTSVSRGRPPLLFQNRFAVIRFAGSADVVVPFTSHANRNALFNDISAVSYSSGSTRTDLAIDAALQLFEQRVSRRRDR